MTATDGQHFADVMPIELKFLDSDTSFTLSRYSNTKMVDFNCRTTDVAQHLTKLLALSERNNRFSSDTGVDPVLYQNIHTPSFKRLPKSLYLNETDPIGTTVFKVNMFFSSFLLVCIF